MYNENDPIGYDHHEQSSTSEVEPASAHTPGSKPPRMGGEAQLSGPMRQQLAEEAYLNALSSADVADPSAQNGCGCGQKPRENEGCGCGGKDRQDGR